MSRRKFRADSYRNPVPTDSRKSPNGVRPPRTPGMGSLGRGWEWEKDWNDWFAHYVATTCRDKVRGSQAAKRQFGARRAEGRSVDDLKLATVGCHSDPWLVKRHHDVPETILRDPNVTRYIEMGKAAEPARRLPDREQLASQLDELTAAWPAVTTALQKSVRESTYELWLAHIEPLGYDGETVYLAASLDVRAWVERRYSSLILQALEAFGPPYSQVRFIAKGESNA